MPEHLVSEAHTRGAIIAMLVITTCVVVPRLVLSIKTARRFLWEDFWLALAYITFITLSVCYLVYLDVLFRFTGVVNGSIKVYPTFLVDIITVKRTQWSLNWLLWIVLWSVKYSLLSFYKQLLSRLAGFVRLWWVVVIFSAVLFFSILPANMVACKDGPTAYWNVAVSCADPESTRRVLIVNWYAYGADVLTDLLVMLLPLGIIRRAQMPLRKKASIGALFCLAFVCIIVATIRIEAISNSISPNLSAGPGPVITWLAFWGGIEAGIACIIGSAPGLYREVRGIDWSKGFASKLRSSTQRFTIGSRRFTIGVFSDFSKLSGFSRSDKSSKSQDTAMSSVNRSSYTPGPMPQKYGRAHTRHPADDVYNSSQEELNYPQPATVGDIHVVRTVGVGVQEKDSSSMAGVGWDDPYYSRV